MKYKQCEQKRCGLLGTNRCPTCPECKAPSNMIYVNDSCVSCFCCAGDEGFIRDNVEGGQMDIKQSEKEKEMEIER